MLMYSRQTSVSTQLGGRPTIVFSGDVSSIRQHSITGHATEERFSPRFKHETTPITEYTHYLRELSQWINWICENLEKSLLVAAGRLGPMDPMASYAPALAYPCYCRSVELAALHSATKNMINPTALHWRSVRGGRPVPFPHTRQMWLSA